MVVKNLFNIDYLTDVTMTRLFQMAEYVCIKTNCIHSKANSACVTEPPCAPAAPTISTAQQEIKPTIRFCDQDRMVEGELFK